MLSDSYRLYLSMLHGRELNKQARKVEVIASIDPRDGDSHSRSYDVLIKKVIN